VIRAETPAFDEVIDFWRLPLEGGPETLRLIEADAPDTNFEHALVYLRGGGEPRLHRFAGGGFVYASVTPMAQIPASLEVIDRLDAIDGSVGSYVLEDPARRVVYIPFSPSEAVRAFRGELYVPPQRAGRRSVLKAYYAVKRVVPRNVLMAVRSWVARRQTRSVSFPRWPLETSLDELQRLVLKYMLRAARTPSLPFVWFWPSGMRAAVTLTHDVEGADGLAAVARFIEAEREFGAVSSFNLVPSKYEIPDTARQQIESAGCEVGVHGWDHQGSLVADRATFMDRAARINEVADRWGASGFRSPSTYRKPDWLAELRFDYDSSFPDTDPYEPQPGGCLSLFPFKMGDMVELPITMPQDHTQFVLLGQRDTEIWRKKAEALTARNGLVCMLTHPDTAEGYAGSDRVFQLYREMLGAFAADDTLWRALPRDVARWWRARSRTAVSSDGLILGAAVGDDVRTARASLRGNDLELVLTEPTQGGGRPQ
jgi:hypothetical protein